MAASYNDGLSIIMLYSVESNTHAGRVITSADADAGPCRHACFLDDVSAVG